MCPRCQGKVIGHGWRLRWLRDWAKDRIRVPRGRCGSCRLFLTMLPHWAVPGSPYSLAARQQAEQMAVAQDLPVEQCIPPTVDPAVAPDPSTVRRWLVRRVESLWAALASGLGRVPTRFAWDWKASRHILIPEANTG